MANNKSTQPEDDQTEQIARNIYEDVRRLNHTTAGPPGLTYPGTAYTILGNLSAAVHSLGQTLEQLDRFLGDELNAGRLGHDLGHNPITEIQRAQDGLRAAGAVARDLGNTLGHAQSAINAVNAQPELSPVRLATQAFPHNAAEAVRNAGFISARTTNPPPRRPTRPRGRTEA
ncbi:hypothetical protein EDD29_8239 [Actinocorallia herbida]|uniref:Uncharacterized protein n=1 Tax=Actinocorallia herbida TaxID=58109 RepID=A0A3N1DAI3_9ACTN|nr:hypothetical protein [Actinocorallia herbida]ROO90510.1 hypothetical protein EDD29_8239 [Actinocorallia herbida]